MATKEVISEVVVRALDGAKEQPDMRAAGRALGTSARIIAETVRTALLPLAVMNLGVRKFETYLRGKFADELDAATASIPEDALQEPPLNVAGPVMQGLTFTHESEQLRRMFLALLATSMDANRSDGAHPAFADIIRQLEPTEATILAALFATDGGMDIIRFQKRFENPRSTVLIQEHVLPLWIDPDIAQPDLRKTAAYVDNWIRLGLIEVDYDRAFALPTRYRWVDEWPATVRLRELHGDDLIVDNGSLVVTAWGQEFAAAIRSEASEQTGFRFGQTAEEPGDQLGDAIAPQVIDGGRP